MVVYGAVLDWTCGARLGVSVCLCSMWQQYGNIEKLLLSCGG